jgi:prevent-host-death family protein
MNFPWYIPIVKTVSISELKRSLSALLEEAAQGRRILITRRKNPIASLTSSDLEHLHVGPKAGKASLKPFLRRANQGKYLEFLADDRRGEPEGR